jgi:hypothetical protein
MKRNRVTEKSYPNSQTLKERIEMTSRMRSVAFKALLVGLASLILVFAGPVSTVLADGSHHNSPGQPGHNGGIQFYTPFIIGITGLLINKVTDCATGVAIAPEKLTAEFVFADGAQPPFHFSQLKKIIIKAEGYQPKEIIKLMTMQFSFGFLKLILIIPLEGDICLLPQPPAQETVQVAPGCTKSLGTYAAAQAPSIDVAPDAHFATAIIVDNGDGTHTLQVTGNSLGRTTFTFSYTDAAGVRTVIEYTVEVTPICGP